jgi:hypothetical protein
MGACPLAKTKISSTDLVWIFREKLSSFNDCSPEIPIAIVPSGGGAWKAVTAPRDRTGRPHCVGVFRFRSSFARFSLCKGEGLRALPNTRHHALQVGGIQTSRGKPAGSRRRVFLAVYDPADLSCSRWFKRECGQWRQVR